MSTMFDMFGKGAIGQPMAPSPMKMPVNPMQKIQMVMRAMQNPGAFLKQKFPDIPDQYMNNPNLIMQYLQQTRGITEQDIQNVQAQIPQMR